MLSEALSVTARVGKVLDELGVPWLVGGSLSSALQGVPPSNQDIDLVAALKAPHAAAFSEALAEIFMCPKMQSTAPSAGALAST